MICVQPPFHLGVKRRCWYQMLVPEGGAKEFLVKFGQKSFFSGQHFFGLWEQCIVDAYFIPRIQSVCVLGARALLRAGSYPVSRLIHSRSKIPSLMDYFKATKPSPFLERLCCVPCVRLAELSLLSSTRASANEPLTL